MRDNVASCDRRLDRCPVKRCLRHTEWKPYLLAARADTLLTTHAAFQLRRAAYMSVDSAQVPGFRSYAVGSTLAATKR